MRLPIGPMTEQAVMRDVREAKKLPRDEAVAELKDIAWRYEITVEELAKIMEKYR